MNHVDLPLPPGSSCMVLLRCMPFGAWPWEYMPRGHGHGNTCHMRSALSLAHSFARCDSSVKWLECAPGLRSSSLLSAVSSLPYCSSSAAAPPAERRQRLALPPTWRQSPPISADLAPISANLRLLGANLRTWRQSPPTWSQSPRCGCCSRAQLCRRRRGSRRRQSRQTRCRSRRSSSSTRAHA
jgi:hypothetical protein